MADPGNRPADSWNTYWQGTGAVGAYTSGGVSHPVIRNFWQAYFSAAREHYTSPTSLLDVATGNGAIVDLALAGLKDIEPQISCVDISEAAIANIRSRFPAVAGIVSDASKIPVSSASFEFVTSQFGVEYAGAGAILEAARTVAPGGQLALMIHNTGSSIHAECTLNLEAVQRLKASQFIPRAIHTLDAAFNASRGGDRGVYEKSAKRLQPAIEAVDVIMSEYGQGVAAGTIARLYDDVARIHGNLLKYDAPEVMAWLNGMIAEVDAYADRMASMQDAAIDETVFLETCTQLGDMGFTFSVSEALVPQGEDEPLAWVLVGTCGDAIVPFSLEQVPATDAHLGAKKSEVQEWVGRKLRDAVNDLMGGGNVTDEFFEAKPSWFVPGRTLIGRIRRPQDRFDFRWFISNDAGTDYLGGGAASTARDAARHFAMKWQLDAERLQKESGASTEKTDALILEAEVLYKLVEDDSVW